MNKECPFSREILPFLRGELDLNRSGELERHFRECPVCSEHLAGTRRLLQVLGNVEEVEPAPGLVDGVMRKLRRRRVVKKALLAVSTGLAAAAVVVLAVFIGMPRMGGDDVGGRAMEWLLRIQRADGSWDAASWGGDARFNVGVSALALLSMLGREEKGTEEALQRSAAFLVSSQNEDGSFGPRFFGLPYNTAVATAALLRFSRKHTSMRVRSSVSRALAFVCKTQQPCGGWGYYPRSAPNSAVSAWHLLALIEAVDAGMAGEEDGKVLEKGVRWLASLVDEGGYVGYRRRGDFPAGNAVLTAMGGYVLLRYRSLAGREVERLSALVRRVRALRGLPPSRLGVYGTFFLAGALRMCGERVRDWSGYLAASQVKEGDARGSWSPVVDRWGTAGGRVYTTSVALMALSLINGG